MAITNRRSKVLFLPVVRSFFNPELGRIAKKRAALAADKLGMTAIFPADDRYTSGSICTDADVREYHGTQWGSQIADIKGMIVVGGNFMEERAFQDTLRLLPPDVPLFLVFQNDDPSNMEFENRGDAYCGALSIHRNAQMLGRKVLRSRGIDMAQEQILDATLGEFVGIMNGAEALRNMRIGMLGVNPVEFATTFTNQMKLFELGFSLHPYELLDLWGGSVFAARQQQFPEEVRRAFPGIKPSNPIRADDPRIGETRARLTALLGHSRTPEDRIDVMVRAFLWIRDIFERDGIDVGGIHCWTTFEQYFQITPCTFSAMANSILRKPIVCETDICHAIMTGLAWAITGEPGVILDLNNPGWDPRVVSMFHCSQTPPEWIAGTAEVDEHTIIAGAPTVGRGNAYGVVEGPLAPSPFTAVSAATSSSSFDATIFQGRVLREEVKSFGSNGWAFIPNHQDVLDVIHKRGIHHCVIMKGLVADQVRTALEFRGLDVVDMSAPVRSLDEIEKELGPAPKGGRQTCPLHSF